MVYLGPVSNAGWGSGNLAFRPKIGRTHHKCLPLKTGKVTRGDPPNTLILTHPAHPMGVNLLFSSDLTGDSDLG